MFKTLKENTEIPSHSQTDERNTPSATTEVKTKRNSETQTSPKEERRSANRIFTRTVFAQVFFNLSVSYFKCIYYFCFNYLHSQPWQNFFS